jgi:hypothetical protein
VNSIFIPDFPLTLPLSPDSGGEGGVRGDSHGAFYATFRLISGSKLTRIKKPHSSIVKKWGKSCGNIIVPPKSERREAGCWVEKFTSEWLI